MTLSDGTQYKITVKKWLTPKGNWINDSEGLTPDIEVELDKKYYETYDNEDDTQLQRYTPFTIEINVYTSGDSKVLKNRQLCNIIIAILQSNGPLQNYYCRGLKLEENSELDSLLDSAYRRVIRMSGLCDNSQKLIK